MLALMCLSEKKSPTELLRVYDVVEGKLRKKAAAALAEFRANGGKHKWLKSGDEPAHKPEDHFAELQLTDREGIPLTYRYSMADAAAEGLVKPKSRWEKRPGNMLRARCISNGLGMLCPEIFAGDDSESESLPTPASAIDLSKTEPKSEPVIEVTATKVETAKPVESTPEPAKEEPKTFAQGPAYSAPVGAKLSGELVDQVQAAIGEHAIAAGAWMVKEGWLRAGQDLGDLPEARARRILKQRDGFIKAITAK